MVRPRKEHVKKTVLFLEKYGAELLFLCFLPSTTNNLAAAYRPTSTLSSGYFWGIDMIEGRELLYVFKHVYINGNTRYLIMPYD